MSSAPVEEVWPLIGEAHRWKEWSFLDRTELEREGVPVPDGLPRSQAFLAKLTVDLDEFGSFQASR